MIGFLAQITGTTGSCGHERTNRGIDVVREFRIDETYVLTDKVGIGANHSGSRIARSGVAGSRMRASGRGGHSRRCSCRRETMEANRSSSRTHIIEKMFRRKMDWHGDIAWAIAE